MVSAKCCTIALPTVLGETGADAGVHVAIVARADVEQLDRVADRGGVELRQAAQVDGHSVIVAACRKGEFRR